MRPRFAVFCSGGGSNFEALAEAVRRGRIKADLALMVCDNPKAFAIKRAARLGIPVVAVSPRLFASRSEYEKFIVGILKSQKVRFVALAGFMRILTGRFINAYRGRILNVHPSLLPAFKGAHAIKDAFEAKVRVTGVTIHLVTVKLDSGPILAQKAVRVSRTDTLKSLEKKIHQVEHRLYPRALQKFIGGK